MQDDLLFPMLTVEETLMFAAEFRLPRALSKSKKKMRVQALIDQLGLRNAANTIIGDEGHRGVSGGERRRVSIGTDIVHDPIILFLDEPTSGLDSTSAFMVVKVLQRHTVFSAAGSRMSSVEKYDVCINEWVAMEGLPRFRPGCVGFFAGEEEEREFWVMGGYGEDDFRRVVALHHIVRLQLGQIQLPNCFFPPNHQS